MCRCLSPLLRNRFSQLLWFTFAPANLAFGHSVGLRSWNSQINNVDLQRNAAAVIVAECTAAFSRGYSPQGWAERTTRRQPLCLCILHNARVHYSPLDVPSRWESTAYAGFTLQKNKKKTNISCRDHKGEHGIFFCFSRRKLFRGRIVKARKCSHLVFRQKQLGSCSLDPERKSFANLPEGETFRWQRD